jgi:hypothetical protein
LFGNKNFDVVVVVLKQLFLIIYFENYTVREKRVIKLQPENSPKLKEYNISWRMDALLSLFLSLFSHEPCTFLSGREKQASTN